MDSLPTFWDLIFQFFFNRYVEDFVFYLSHWVLHLKPFYGPIHKQHHEYKVTVSIATEYAHPIEYVFANIVASSSGSFIMGPRIHYY